MHQLANIKPAFEPCSWPNSCVLLCVTTDPNFLHNVYTDTRPVYPVAKDQKHLNLQILTRVVACSSTDAASKRRYQWLIFQWKEENPDGRSKSQAQRSFCIAAAPPPQAQTSPELQDGCLCLDRFLFLFRGGLYVRWSPMRVNTLETEYL